MQFTRDDGRLHPAAGWDNNYFAAISGRFCGCICRAGLERLRREDIYHEMPSLRPDSPEVGTSAGKREKTRRRAALWGAGAKGEEDKRTESASTGGRPTRS